MRWLRAFGRTAMFWLAGGRKPLDRLDLSEIYGDPRLISRDGGLARIGTAELLDESARWDRLLLFEALPRA